MSRAYNIQLAEKLNWVRRGGRTDRRTPPLIESLEHQLILIFTIKIGSEMNLGRAQLRLKSLCVALCIGSNRLSLRWKSWKPSSSSLLRTSPPWLSSSWLTTLSKNVSVLTLATLSSWPVGAKTFLSGGARETPSRSR